MKENKNTDGRKLCVSIEGIIEEGLDPMEEELVWISLWDRNTSCILIHHTFDESLDQHWQCCRTELYNTAKSDCSYKCCMEDQWNELISDAPVKKRRFARKFLLILEFVIRRRSLDSHHRVTLWYNSLQVISRQQQEEELQRVIISNILTVKVKWIHIWPRAIMLIMRRCVLEWR